MLMNEIDIRIALRQNQNYNRLISIVIMIDKNRLEKE